MTVRHYCGRPSPRKASTAVTGARPMPPTLSTAGTRYEYRCGFAHIILYIGQMIGPNVMIDIYIYYVRDEYTLHIYLFMICTIYCLLYNTHQVPGSFVAGLESNIFICSLFRISTYTRSSTTDPITAGFVRGSKP